jgi:hypothetical protein
MPAKTAIYFEIAQFALISSLCNSAEALAGSAPIPAFTLPPIPAKPWP